MKRVRRSGPHGVVRPFIPTPEITETLSVEEKTLETLEHIAVALSAIDHTLETVAAKLDGLLQIQARQHR